MRILLISPNTEQINMPVMPLGMACVARAAQRAGHSVKTLNLMTPADSRKRVLETVYAFHPDAIGISVRNIDDQSATRPRFLLDAVKPVVDACRLSSVSPIILGGAGFSIFPQSVLNHLGADMGIQGEGEGVFIELLSCLERGECVPGLPGLHFSDGRPVHPFAVHKTLDDYELPLLDPSFPVRSDTGEGAIWLPFQTRRGCAMDCSYCSTPVIEGRRLRKRSIVSVVAALHHYVKAGISKFYFVDNTFNLPMSYAKALCDAIIESGIDIHWQAIVYPNFVDEELAAKMTRAGCVQVSLGFESGDETMLKRMNKRTDPSTIERISCLFKAHGIRRMGFLLLGGPGESVETVQNSFDFADRLDLDSMRLSVGIRIYPHTAIERLARSEGLISANDTLLHPRFYLRSELAGWLLKTASDLAAAHKNWIS